MTPDARILRDSFRQAMQRLASTVCILTGGQPGAHRGLTATAVCSLTAEPPAVLVCINRSAGAHDAILGAGVVGVNLLSVTQLPLAERFAGMTGAVGKDRFAGADWVAGGTGAPLLRNALAALDCRIAASVPFHTHTVLLCRIEDLRLGEDSGPLLYGARAFRFLGDPVRAAPADTQHHDFDAFADLPTGWN